MRKSVRAPVLRPAAGRHAAIRHLKACDPVLAAIMERVGKFAMNYHEPSFEAMARSIVFQQLAGKAAATIFQRFSDLCAEGNGSSGACSISPERVLRLSEQGMRDCGLSRQKIGYIRDLAAKAQSGEVDFARLPLMEEAEIIDHLTRVKGIGVWSAQMFLMFALRRPDIMPVSDYGIRAAMQRNYRKRKLPTPAQMIKMAEPWRPFRSIACWYLWRSLENSKPNSKPKP